MPPKLLDRAATIRNLKDQHKGSEDLAINNNFIRRTCTLVALKTTARFFKRNGSCIPISKRLIVKTGPRVHLAEAATMRYVTVNTSIPVPKVHCSFLHKDRAFIVMERIHGKNVPAVWKTLSQESRNKIFAQLRVMFQELRALKPPDQSSVQSCVGGTVREARISRDFPRMGPFKTIQEFHLFLRENFQTGGDRGWTSEEDWEALMEMATKQDGPWPAPVVFTHGDLNPFNILVRGNQVVAIIDWECAGWFPSYWEYTSAWYGSLTRTTWQDVLPKFLDVFPEELEMEKVRNRWWGEY